MVKKDFRKRAEVAGRMYEPADYQREDELSNGLALTHEQANDSYVEGEAGGEIEHTSEASDELNRKGYQ
ncbi:hypothetical protein UB32_16385 [Mesobacillus subterraneus]|uniref:DUF4025 domain-containing protein n=1 Tax=Mesobacillus subterraneus TaxID=285983 RepID=A0A0D6Z7F0_9BACI|nr:YozQ family protein [Mesobacillus subterraneus]KIY20951.1 hypothetical protein UB32_16385 [Mesobacillus subterraneus]